MNTNQFRPGGCRDWAAFLPHSSPADSSGTLQKYHVGLCKVIVLQGGEPELRTLLKRGPPGGGAKTPPHGKKQRKATCFMEGSDRENKNITNVVLWKRVTLYLSHVWVWRWSLHYFHYASRGDDPEPEIPLRHLPDTNLKILCKNLSVYPSALESCRKIIPGDDEFTNEKYRPLQKKKKKIPRKQGSTNKTIG